MRHYTAVHCCHISTCTDAPEARLKRYHHSVDVSKVLSDEIFDNFLWGHALARSEKSLLRKSSAHLSLFQHIARRPVWWWLGISRVFIWGIEIIYTKSFWFIIYLKLVAGSFWNKFRNLWDFENVVRSKRCHSAVHSACAHSLQQKLLLWQTNNWTRSCSRMWWGAMNLYVCRARYSAITFEGLPKSFEDF